jgi:hypothetical protein
MSVAATRPCKNCGGTGHIETAAGRQARVYQERVKRGLCGRCGKRRIALHSIGKCQVCLNVNAAHQREYQGR